MESAIYLTKSILFYFLTCCSLVYWFDVVIENIALENITLSFPNEFRTSQNISSYKNRTMIL